MKHRCPACHKITNLSHQEKNEKVKFFPFCSDRCKLVDLGVWLDGRYKIISEVLSQQSGEQLKNFSERPSDNG
jgi:endogenous inhibitor of DNA gyrase (YacG/DUF329 family)